jgi:hypothetical protein
MKPIWPIVMLGSLLILTSPGCAGRSLEPEAVAVDQVACARCGMLVSSLDRAAQAVYADADTRVYDDVGCLATDRESRTGTYRFYVHTRDGRWTEVGMARFVHDAGVSTPMSYGIVALTEAEAARQQVAALTWTEIVARLGEERR